MGITFEYLDKHVSLLVPHYLRGKLVDRCFWCRRTNCQNGHGLEMTAYRIALHVRAMELLENPRDLRAEAQIASLLALRPREMSLKEHTLKGHYLRLVKTLTPTKAWYEAKRLMKKEAGRSKCLFPRFSKTERTNIAKYRPRSAWSYWSGNSPR